jgi:hypothetical protein
VRTVPQPQRLSDSAARTEQHLVEGVSVVVEGVGGVALNHVWKPVEEPSLRDVLSSFRIALYDTGDVTFVKEVPEQLVRVHKCASSTIQQFLRLREL